VQVLIKFILNPLNTANAIKNKDAIFLISLVTYGSLMMNLNWTKLLLNSLIITTQTKMWALYF
jgi:hypothetical protein